MKCPFCHSQDTVVKDTRTDIDNNTIKRRRLCENCGKRFNTFEKVELIPLMVVKKDGTRQPYDRNKIRRGLIQACHKRCLNSEVVEQMIDNIEKRVYNLEGNIKEIPSSKIGAIVLEELKQVDEVAFIRFASIYNEFDNVDTFRRELDRLCEKE